MLTGYHLIDHLHTVVLSLGVLIDLITMPLCKLQWWMEVAKSAGTESFLAPPLHWSL